MAPPRPGGPNASELAAQWQEARSVYPIYLALTKQFDLGLPFSSEKRTLPDRPTQEVFDRVRRWLDDMDQQVQTHQLRKLLQSTTLNSSEEGLRALILRHLRKSQKNKFDRDKIDFLLVQYFALEAPPKIYHKQIDLQDVAQVLRPVFGEVEPTPLEWCRPLEAMIDGLRGFRSLRQLLTTNFISEGRKVKESAGGMFYDPASLLAFIRFNFLLRRAFIELMHADLIAIRAALEVLEGAGVRFVDCRRAGLSEAEPVPKLLQLCNEWKQPFQKEYTQNAVEQAFSKLLALRAALEQAAEQTRARLEGTEKKSQPAHGAPRGGAGNSPASSAAVPKTPAKPSVPVANPVVTPAPAGRPSAANSRGTTAGGLAKQPSATSSAPLAQEKASETPAAESPMDLDTCMEKIWEQLIAAPPARGRSMTTVAIEKTRILMSSWEVAAFVTDGGRTSDDLRRAVSARAAIAVAIDSFETTGDRSKVRAAIDVARKEISSLQERVEAAKRVKNTEAAVNLGISTKRLLSVIDEAEKI
jgi:hypothetical protein